MAQNGNGNGQPRASSRDRAVYVRNDEEARRAREQVAEEVAESVRSHIVASDVMGGRTTLAQCVQQLVRAERQEDVELVRVALVDLAGAAGAWIAALDFVPPHDYATRRGDPAM